MPTAQYSAKSSRAIRGTALAAVCGLLLAASTACSGSGGVKASASASPSSDLPSSGVPYSTPGATTALGTLNEPIPTQIPEAVHVNAVPAITSNEMVVTEDHGSQLVGIHVIDPKTGKTVSSVDSADVNFWAMDFPIVGTVKGLPNILSAEDWRPRGLRGAADHVVTWYSGNLVNPFEIKLPSDTRWHAENESASLTADGRFLIGWDDAVYGLRVVDLKNRKAGGTLREVGCGPFTWVIGHDVYTPCIGTGQIIKIHIGDDGTPTLVNRAVVFGSGFIGSRDAAFSASAKVALIVDPEGKVYRIDLSGGLPTKTISPIGTIALAKGETPQPPVLSADGTHFAVAIQAVAIQDATSTVRRVEAFDAKTLKQIYSIAATSASAPTSISYSATGDVFYVLSTAEQRGSSVPVLTGYDPLTGAKKTSATLTTTMAATPTGLGNLGAPIEIGSAG